MEAHVVLGGVGVLAAFGCGAAASASVAGRARRRTASLVGEGDVGSSRVAWLLRNGVGWTRPATRALLGNRALAALMREAVGVVDARGLMTTEESLLSVWIAAMVGAGMCAGAAAGSVVCGITVAVCACACAVGGCAPVQDKRRDALREGIPRRPALHGRVLPGRLVAAANVPAGGKRGARPAGHAVRPRGPPAGNRGRAPGAPFGGAAHGARRWPSWRSSRWRWTCSIRRAAA